MNGRVYDPVLGRFLSADPFVQAPYSSDADGRRWRSRGRALDAKCTNTIAAAGLPGLGGKADLDGMTFFRFKEAKIVEEWSIIDIATMKKQLGIKANWALQAGP